MLLSPGVWRAFAAPAPSYRRRAAPPGCWAAVQISVASHRVCDVTPSPRMPSHRLRLALSPLLVASGLTDRFSSSMVLFCLAGLEPPSGPYSARSGCRAPSFTILLYSPRTRCAYGASRPHAVLRFPISTSEFSLPPFGAGDPVSASILLRFRCGDRSRQPALTPEACTRPGPPTGVFVLYVVSFLFA